MEWQAIGLSLRLALLTTLILLVVGLPAAHWLAFSRRKWKFLVEAVVALPLVLPPTVLGFYILLAIGPRGPIGRIYGAITGGMLPFSFGGLAIASVLYSLPFAVQPFTSGFLAVDRKLIEASWCLGVSRTVTFFRVIVPLAAPAIVTGMILSFAHTLGEFGVVLMVGGNLPGITRTVSIAIFDDVQALNYTRAMNTSLVLLAISFVVLAATYGWRRLVYTATPITTVWGPRGTGWPVI
jgi:molybdate transport system permease protein